MGNQLHCPESERKMKKYKIYISSAAGLSYTGVWTETEEEAKELCRQYNEQDGHNPYCQHICRAE